MELAKFEGCGRWSSGPNTDHRTLRVKMPLKSGSGVHDRASKELAYGHVAQHRETIDKNCIK